MKKEPDKFLKEKSTKPSVFSLLKPYRNLVIFLIFFAIISNGVTLLIPIIISNGIDSFANGVYDMKDVIVKFVQASFLILLFTALQGVIQTYASEMVARDLRKKLSDKISQQSHGFIQKANPSKLLTNLTSDIDSIKLFVSMAIVSMVSSVFIIIGASALLISINWKLALPVISIIPIIGGAFFLIFKNVKELFKKARAVIDWLNKVINESIMGASIIRVLNTQQLEYFKFVAANTDGLNNGLAILRLFSLLIPIIIFTSNLAYLVILALGGHFVIAGKMSMGDFAAFNNYVMLLIFPILIIGFMSNIIAQASASYGRIGEVLDAPNTEEPGTEIANLNGDIEIRNVTVMYDDKPALKDVSISIKAGSQTAIIGPTAAGKRQLLYLLTSLMKPDSGSIEFDGKNIDTYKKETFHNQIGFVFQDSILFNLSLRENIAFSDTVTDESLQMAIDTAELNDFVNSLPQKLDTIVSERGNSLSGGQKQRIMLARALAVNPKILLLDDFTARVDKTTEHKILCNIFKNYPKLTLISVTQKIASIKNYNQIILLMEGEVIAKGTHNELKESCPEYIQIYNSQRSTSHYEL